MYTLSSKMFRIFIFTFLFTFYFSCVLTEKKDEKYTTKYDNIDLENVVKNERLLKNYLDCLLDKGRCTPDALELKTNMQDALQTDCSKCSAKQKDGSNFIINYLIEHKPEYWEELETKYDPERIYTKKYLEADEDEVTEAVTDKDKQ